MRRVPTIHGTACSGGHGAAQLRLESQSSSGAHSPVEDGA